MTTAVIYGLLAFALFLLVLYSLDLIFFLLREKKRFEGQNQSEEYIAYLEGKQKKAKHPQKKNYYLYLVCVALSAAEQKEKVQRLLPFLRNDPLLGVFQSDFTD